MKTATFASLLLVNALAQQDQTPADPPQVPDPPTSPDQTPDQQPDPDQSPDDTTDDQQQDDDPQTPDGDTPPPKGAEEILAALTANELTALADALGKESQAPVVQDLLDDDDGWTLFAPQNAALEPAASDLSDEELTAVFQYHASADPFDPKTAEFPAVVETLYEVDSLEGNQVVIVMHDGDGGDITIKSGADTDAKVAKAIPFGDNWVHAIDGVLAMPKSPSEVASAIPELSSLVEALTDLDLVENVDGLTDITIFAPNNNAFAAVEGDATAELLTYHIAKGAVYSPKIASATVGTEQGDSLEIVVDGDSVTLVDGSDSTINVVSTDYLTSNGVIHIIDTVLTPSGQAGPADDDDDDGDGTADAPDGAAALQMSFAAILCLLALL